MVSASCSTTRTVLPRSRSRCSESSSRSLSRGCSPIDGSSRTYKTPRSFEPICVARRMRCASPPDSVAEIAPDSNNPTPRPSKNQADCESPPPPARRFAARVREASNSSTVSSARVIDMAVNSAIATPFTCTARLDGFKPLPWQPGHTAGDMIVHAAIRAMLRWLVSCSSDAPEARSRVPRAAHSALSSADSRTAS